MIGSNPGSGATDAGPSTGAHDFVANSASGAKATGGKDFTGDNREQSAGKDETINAESIPSGGVVMIADPVSPGRVSPVGLPTGGKVPFRVRG